MLNIEDGISSAGGTAMARDWNDAERLAAMYLYCQTPFGKLHKNNPDIIALSERMGRTPSSLAMKLTNFASLDPEQQERGIRGLAGASQGDREIWRAFLADWSGMAERSAHAFEAFGTDLLRDSPEEPCGPPGPTSVSRMVKARRGQDWFRAVLAAGYDSQCCVSGCDVDSMLVASHIIPWAADESLRLNPHNGLLLSAIHDRAFEHGYLVINDDYSIAVASSIRASTNDFLRNTLGRYHGARLRMPTRFIPDRTLLRRHREAQFRG